MSNRAMRQLSLAGMDLDTLLTLRAGVARQLDGADDYDYLLADIDAEIERKKDPT